VYRFLLTPRWLGITALGLLAIPFCVFMGTWQLSRFEARVAQHRAAEQAPAPGSGAAVPLARVLPGFDAQVTTASDGTVVRAVGRYDAAHQLLVPNRYLGDRAGFYVLDLLRVSGSGAALPVVRGWLPGSAAHPGAVPPVPTGQVTVEGTLQAPEAVGDSGVDAGGGLPAGQLGMISAASLINIVPYHVYDGWITLTTATAPLKPVPPVSAPNSGLNAEAFQNLGYTGEWFVFAGFVVFIWIRLVRREAETVRDRELGLLDDETADAGEPADAAAEAGQTAAETADAAGGGADDAPEPVPAPGRSA
jgi:cytochrome oxidase assembly protein ShyY1